MSDDSQTPPPKSPSSASSPRPRASSRNAATHRNRLSAVSCPDPITCSSGCVAGGLLLGLANDRAGSLGRALVAATRHHLGELGPIGNQFQRRERRVLEVAVQRDGQKFVVRLLGLDGGEGAHPDRLDGRVALILDIGTLVRRSRH